MVRISDLPDGLRPHIVDLACPQYDSAPFVAGPPLAERRVAIVSTAGLQRRGDRPFAIGSADYRVIFDDTDAGDMVMSHISTNYDRSGFEQDLNVVFPIDRLRELAADGEIGSVARYHYSFMGATDPAAMEETARHLVLLQQSGQVDACLLVPV